ncbi:MAG: hypothetical protein ACYTGZ_11155 [Planctomycetota bacterium]
MPSPLLLAANDVVILESLRFLGADGKEALVEPGIYAVAEAGDKTMRLSAKRSGRTFLLRAERARHEGKLRSPLARILRLEDSSANHLVLWSRGGKQLRAVGFPAAVRPRGGRVEVREATRPSSATLTVTRPGYRDVWVTGGAGRIDWVGDGARPAVASVALFTEAGAFVKELATTDGAGSFVWKDVSAVPGRYVIFVRHGSAHDFSDVFAIAAPPEPEPAK